MRSCHDSARNGKGDDATAVEKIQINCNKARERIILMVRGVESLEVDAVGILIVGMIDRLTMHG